MSLREQGGLPGLMLAGMCARARACGRACARVRERACARVCVRACVRVRAWCACGRARVRVRACACVWGGERITSAGLSRRGI